MNSLRDTTGIGSYRRKFVAISWSAVLLTQTRSCLCSLSLTCQPVTTSVQGCAPALCGALTVCPFTLRLGQDLGERLNHTT
ncbi:hypothetical protein BDV11DRAFT_197143 [Aspergillus similis]